MQVGWRGRHAFTPARPGSTHGGSQQQWLLPLLTGVDEVAQRLVKCEAEAGVLAAVLRGSRGTKERLATAAAGAALQQPYAWPTSWRSHTCCETRHRQPQSTRIYTPAGAAANCTHSVGQGIKLGLDARVGGGAKQHKLAAAVNGAEAGVRNKVRAWREQSGEEGPHQQRGRGGSGNCRHRCSQACCALFTTAGKGTRLPAPCSQAGSPFCLVRRDTTPTIGLSPQLPMFSLRQG